MRTRAHSEEGFLMVEPVAATPVQAVTGADHKSYKVKTFIRLLANPSISTRSEKVLAVVVRNASVSGSRPIGREPKGL